MKKNVENSSTMLMFVVDDDYALLHSSHKVNKNILYVVVDRCNYKAWALHAVADPVSRLALGAAVGLLTAQRALELTYQTADAQLG